ncbi:redox-sensing transcriptional repressor Rex [Papillibacter cinnamivorans]|uniref:Redox-sensing transcriptional repressor Rex n=1 Tax=Papillibacter cinnamivorans DSM 12816 TaxID=1122930 RepID=A0A1W2CAE5_9FIRM|nr:redox-sensing transcriptional repressor Rex [Papillibacter cinnamivorans]SMC81934.1 redox-sensing transcriptional repressor [Papillibacter cinnamivorans DSM 12816]
MRKDKISNAVIRRIPRYYRHVDDLYYNGVVRISSSSLGRIMGLTASQIRQDLSCFGEFGQQGYGYNVEKLRSEIAEVLGMNKQYKIIIIGAGNLGRALIQNFYFAKSGFILDAAFDVASDVINTEINGVHVHHIDALEDYVVECKPDVAVLTVPRSVAQKTAERLVGLGVRGLWNFTNIELNIRDANVKIEDVHFADSLLTLSYMIANRDTP